MPAPFSAIGQSLVRAQSLRASRASGESSFLFGTDSALASSADGADLEVAQGTLDGILARPDREARRTAWENYMDTYVAFANTLPSSTPH